LDSQLAIKIGDLDSQLAINWVKEDELEWLQPASGNDVDWILAKGGHASKVHFYIGERNWKLQHVCELKGYL